MASKTNAFISPYMSLHDSHVDGYSQKLAAFPGDANAPPTSGRALVVRDGTAIIAITSYLLKYDDAACRWFQGTSCEAVSDFVDMAEANPNVRTIAFHFDSPGGQLAGVPELAAKIAAVSKPTVAVISDMCASAAYYLACACDSIVANPAALVGGIGVYEVLYDTSKMYADAGITAVRIRGGSLKGLGAEGVPITNADVASEQIVITDMYNAFVAAVAKGRGMSVDDVTALATGEVYYGQRALDAGLIDGFGDIETVISKGSKVSYPNANHKALSVVAVVAPKPAIAAAATFTAADVEAAKVAGIAVGREAGNHDARAMFAAIYNSCPGNAAMACREFAAGKSPSQAAATYRAANSPEKLEGDAQAAALHKEWLALDARDKARAGNNESAWAGYRRHTIKIARGY